MKRLHIIIIAIVVFAVVVSNGLYRSGETSVFSMFGNGTSTVGNGISSTQKRTIAACTKVNVEGSIDVIITAGDSLSYVVIEGDSNLLSIVTTDVDSSKVLTISTDGSYSTNSSLVAKIYIPVLEEIVINGSSNATVTNIQSTAIHTLINGSGDIQLSGAVEQFIAEVSGSGNIDSKNLTSKTCSVLIDGSGDIETTCSDSLVVDISGSGDVTYYGNPRAVQTTVSGSGDIIKR